MSTFVIQAFDSTTVVYSGYMTKSPPLLTEKKTLKRWRKRYFVLHPNKAVEYYETDAQKVLKGALDLRECTHIEVGLFYKKRPNVMCLTTLRRKFFFQASSEMEMLYWAETIRMVKNAKEGEEIILPKLFHQREGRDEEITRRTSFLDGDQLESSARSSPIGGHGSDTGSRRFTTDDGRSMSRYKATPTDKRRGGHGPKMGVSPSPSIAGQQHSFTSQSLEDLRGGSHMYHFEPEQTNQHVQKTLQRKYRESMRRKKKTGAKGVTRKPSSDDEQDLAYLGDDCELEDVFEDPERTSVSQSSVIAEESITLEESDTEQHLTHPPIQTQEEEEPPKQLLKKLSQKKRIAITRAELPYLSDTDADDDLISSPPYDRLKPRVKSTSDLLSSDTGYDSSPTLQVEFLSSSPSHSQDGDARGDKSLEKVEFFAEMPSKVEFTHYAAYPFSYSGGSLQPGNSEISVHVPPGAISPYDNLFFPELSSSALWRPILVVNTRTLTDRDSTPSFAPATPIVKFTPTREVMGVLRPVSFSHPISIRIPHSLVPFSAIQSNGAELAVLVATMNKEAQKKMLKTGSVFSNMSFSVFPVNLKNPSNASEVREVLKKSQFAIGVKDRYFLVFAKEVMMSLWLIGGTVQTNSVESPNLSPTGVPSHVHRELQLPMKRCCLRIFTKFSSHSRQHCVVAYLVEKYHDALRTIETLCYKQGFSPCLKEGEHSSLELPVDTALPILATIGRVKGQGYSIGTLEQDMMECDGCWKAAVFYIQFSYNHSTALPKGGVVGLSLKIHSTKQVYVEKNFHLMLKSPV